MGWIKCKNILALLLAALLCLEAVCLPAAAAPGATLSLTTDKTVYDYGEDIVVTATGNSACWVGIYKADDVYGSGKTASIYWYYVNKPGDANGRTNGAPTVIQETTSNNRYTVLPGGSYVVYLFDGSGGDDYNVVKSVEIRVLEPGLEALTSIQYDLGNPGDGFANGTVTVTTTASNDATDCLMYWADANGQPLEGYAPLAKFKLTGETTVFPMYTHTIIPQGARQLIAYAMKGEALSEYPVAVRLPQGSDYGLDDAPIVEFQLTSDTHITTDAGASGSVALSNRHFSLLLEDVKANSPKSIGIFINGDITNGGQEEEYRKLVSLYNQAGTSGTLPGLHIAIGNHDWYQGNPNGLFQRYAAKVNPQLESQPENVYYAETVAGYSFIYLGGEQAGGSAVLSQTQLTWLDNQLAQRTQADPDKPVFVLLHQPLYNTVAGTLPGQGWDGVSNEAGLKKILMKYPQVIIAGGHSHWELNSPQCLYPGDAGMSAALNTASIGYLWTDYEVSGGVYAPGSHGYYVRVFDDHVLVMGKELESGLYLPSAMFVIRRNRITTTADSYTVDLGSSIDLGVRTLDGGTVTYTSSDEAVAAVESGTVTGQSLGTARITITVTGTDTTVVDRKTVTVTVVERHTCSDGDRDHLCDGCGEKLTDHTLGEPVIENETPASCTAQGSYDRVIYCTVCGSELSRTGETTAKLSHDDKTGDGDHGCDACGQDGITACSDGDRDHLCDECGEKLTDHTPGEPVIENETPASCTAQGSYDRVIYCTVCGSELSRTGETTAKLSHDDKTGDGDHACDVCGQGNTTLCADGDDDNLCDECGHTMCDHVDRNPADHLCDNCGRAASVCEDGDNDHLCDVCRKVLSNHTDAAGDGYCDICGGVRIDGSNFPDGNFRGYLLEQDYGEDAFLTAEELAEIQVMDVSGKEIRDLTGIGFFTELTVLHCNRNGLTSLDVSGNGKLEYLHCKSNQLTALDLSRNGALLGLWCDSNRLTELDISENPLLKNLYCGYNQLTGLDISQNAALERLYCYDNLLTSLDVSRSVALKYLDCDGNRLTSLDVTGNPALTDLHCARNAYSLSLECGSPLDLTTLPGDFDVTRAANWSGGTPKGSLLTPESTVVTYTYQVRGSQVETFTLNLEFSHVPGQAQTENEIPATCTAPGSYDEVVRCTGCGEEMSRTSHNTEKLDHVPGEAVVENEKAATCTAPGSYDEVVRCADCGEELSRNGKTLAQLPHSDQTGDGYCDICGGVQIDPTNFPDDNFRNFLLSQEYGEDALLTVEELAGVTELDVSDREIRDLTGVGYFEALERLDCSCNQLTSLDLSKSTKLEWLDCMENQLPSLDVSQNTELEHLSCRYNYLTSLDVRKNTALNWLICEENLLAELDVSQNTALNVLWCQNNQLTELDVSNNTALVYLNCSGNQLTKLDVSRNTALGMLYCNSNQLTELDVSNNTVLGYLSCSSNQLTELDLSRNTELINLFCSSNQLTSLNLCQNAELVILECHENVYSIQLDTNNQFNLSTLPGDFDINKASDWSGGTVSGSILTAESKTITYTYHLGNNRTETFTLQVDAHIRGAVQIENEVKPSCEQGGSYDEVVYCSLCGEELGRENVTVGALGHKDENKDHLCDLCGKDLEEEPSEPEQEAEIIRLAGENRFETALLVAEQMKARQGIQQFDTIILASGGNFADALSGSYLAAVKNAPILLCWNGDSRFNYLNGQVTAYIKENLAPGGRIYILGGAAAVPTSLDLALSRYDVRRLAGADRFETNLLILEEAGVSRGGEILVCTSTNFADSLSASATGKPILLVFQEAGKLWGRQAEYLASLEDCRFTVIGGENAVSGSLEKALGAYGGTTRLSGGNRFETSVLVARTYFQAPERAVLAYAWNYPDGLCGGALAYAMDAPLILTMTGYQDEAVTYAREASIGGGVVLGGDTLISDDAVRAVFAMDADDAIIVK